jgi:hypothetical protein
MPSMLILTIPLESPGDLSLQPQRHSRQQPTILESQPLSLELPHVRHSANHNFGKACLGVESLQVQVQAMEGVWEYTATPILH